MASHKMLIHSARQAVLVVSKGEKILKGNAMKNVVVMDRDGANGISVVVNRYMYINIG